VVDGSVVELAVEAGEIKSNNDAQKAVRQLAKLFAVLERVIVAISAGKAASWSCGEVVIPPATGVPTGQRSVSSRPPPRTGAAASGSANAGGVKYVFIGRIITTVPVSLQDKWTQPAWTGVRLLRPDCVRFVPTCVT
jgi:hypothetical protein